MNNQYNQELVPDRIYFKKAFYMVAIGVIIGLITYLEKSNEEIMTGAIILSGILIVLGLISLWDKTMIKLYGNELIIEKSLFGKIIHKTIDIRTINKVIYEKHVKSNFYTSSGNIKVMGMDATPESWKNYYYHNEIVAIYVEGKKYEIEKWKKRFEGKKLANIISSKINITK